MLVCALVSVLQRAPCSPLWRVLVPTRALWTSELWCWRPWLTRGHLLSGCLYVPNNCETDHIPSTPLTILTDPCDFERTHCDWRDMTRKKNWSNLRCQVWGVTPTSTHLQHNVDVDTDIDNMWTHTDTHFQIVSRRRKLFEKILYVYTTNKIVLSKLSNCWPT